MLSVKNIIVVVLIFLKKSHGVDIYSHPQRFCYEGECGPEGPEWNGVCHSGKSQSPINIDVHNQFPNRFVYLPLEDFSADHWFVQNNGHTVNVDFTPVGLGSRIFPGYGLSREEYKFSNAHFHWGKESSQGSEHELHGRNFSMELHLVHFKESYQTLQNAVASGDPNALAVVAIFLEVDESASPNPALQPIIDILPNIHETHTFWVRGETPIDFRPLIPVNGGIVYSYRGSLTTPTCDEVVHWFVFQDPVAIAPQDVEAFRQILDGEGHALKFNRRPVQPLNGRRIEVILIV